MTDFSTEATKQYWIKNNTSNLLKVILLMESVDNWCKDTDPQIVQALNDLIQTLESTDQIDISDLEDNTNFYTILSNLKTGQAVRLLQHIDKLHPGTASRLLIYAEDVTKNQNDQYGIFLKRNIVFERLRLMSRIFSKKRFDLVLKSLEE